MPSNNRPIGFSAREWKALSPSQKAEAWRVGLYRPDSLSISCVVADMKLRPTATGEGKNRQPQKTPAKQPKSLRQQNREASAKRKPRKCPNIGKYGQCTAKSCPFIHGTLPVQAT